MASILALEKQISVLLEQKKLSSGKQTTAINQQLAALRIQLDASNPIQKTAAAESADCELDSLLTSFSKLRVTAKSHRLRGSNATEDEKKRVEEELNVALDRVTVAKNKKRAHKAGLDAAKDSKLDTFLDRRTDTGTGTVTDDGRKTTGIVHDTTGIMGQHCNPHDKTHPECPGRLLSIMEAIRCTGLYDKCRDIPGRKVTTEELLTVHPMEHIQQVEKLRKKEYRAEQVKKMAQESVYANEHTTEAAYWSCGASMAMTEAVLSGQVQNGLVVARPPGHHAEPCQCMGFCIFNNVAVAAANAVHMGAKKVLIVDWDVHHGNGTQRMFYNNDQIMYVSIHRYDDGSFYPPSKDGGPNMVGGGGASGGGGKGEGSKHAESKSGAGPVARLPGVGTNMNVGWNSKRLSDSDYLAAFEYCIMPACREFSPDLVYVSAGFDAARGDPLGGCDVTPSGYGQMLHQLSSLANGKVIVVLEGGYNLRSIAASTVACLNVLVGGAPSRTDQEHGAAAPPSKPAIKAITATIRAHRDIAKSPWALRFPMLGGGEEEGGEEEEEEALIQPVKDSAEELGKKMRMRNMFEMMRARRAAAAAKKKRATKKQTAPEEQEATAAEEVATATEGKEGSTGGSGEGKEEGRTSANV